MKQRPLKTTHAPHFLTERELRQIGGGNTLDRIPGTPMPEINRNLK